MLGDFGSFGFEEPLPPDDLAGYIELTRVPRFRSQAEKSDAAAGFPALDRGRA